MNAAQPIRSKKQLKKNKKFYLSKKQYRNYTLVVMGFCTALRISDLRRLTWGMVYNFSSGKIKTHISLTEKKTGKNKIIALNQELVKALVLYFSTLSVIDIEQPVFQSNRGKYSVISRVHAYRIIRAAGDAARTETPVGCHSLRKAFGYFAWNSGTSPANLMDIYNHTSIAVTRRYLGICQDDRNKVYMRVWC